MEIERTAAIEAINDFKRILGLKSASALALCAKVSPSTINRKINGADHTNFSLTTLDKLAARAGYKGYADYIARKSAGDKVISKATTLSPPITALTDVFKGLFYLLMDKGLLSATEIAWMLHNQYQGYQSEAEWEAREVTRILQESVLGRDAALRIPKTRPTPRPE